jgi:hypothetical protein
MVGAVVAASTARRSSRSSSSRRTRWSSSTRSSSSSRTSSSSSPTTRWRRSPTRRCCGAPVPVACGPSSKRCCSTSCTTCPSRTDVGSVVIDAEVVLDQGEPHAGAARAGHQAPAPPSQLTRPGMTSYADALAYLETHSNYDTTGRITSPTLERMATLMARWATRSWRYPVIHVTGTNGKGSTTQMITRLLMAHGLTVGTYTSPHLERLNERISRNCEPISDDEFAEQIAAVADLEASPVCGPATSKPSLPPRSVGSPTSPSTSPSSRWACSAAGTPPTCATRRWPSSPTSASTTPSTPAPRRCTSPPRRPASSSPAAPW